jgi:tetratricopeptide (TPR) repeat protein
LENDRSGGCGHLPAAEVEALLEGRLDPERQARFDAHVREGCGECALLAADAAVFAEATSESAVLTSEEREGAERDRAAVDRWVAREGSRRRSHARWRGVGLLAAAASVLLAVVYVGRRPDSSPAGSLALPLADGSSLTIATLPFNPPGVQRGEDDLSGLWAAAGDAYRSGRFKAAAERFAGIAKRAPAASDPLLYGGVSLLAMGRFEEAAATLARADERAKRAGTSGPALDWYRAVALSGSRRNDEAVPLLEGIVRDSSALPVEPGETDYGKLASDLLSRIRNTDIRKRGGNR